MSDKPDRKHHIHKANCSKSLIFVLNINVQQHFNVLITLYLNENGRVLFLMLTFEFLLVGKLYIQFRKLQLWVELPFPLCNALLENSISLRKPIFFFSIFYLQLTQSLLLGSLHDCKTHTFNKIASLACGSVIQALYKYLTHKHWAHALITKKELKHIRASGHAEKTRQSRAPKKIEQTRICQVQDLTTDPERGTEKRRKGRDGETDGCQVSAGLSRQ